MQDMITRRAAGEGSIGASLENHIPASDSMLRTQTQAKIQVVMATGPI